MTREIQKKLHSITFHTISGEGALVVSLMVEEWRRWLPALL